MYVQLEAEAKNQSPTLVTVGDPPGGVVVPATLTITKYSEIEAEAGGSPEPTANPTAVPSLVTVTITLVAASKVPANVMLLLTLKALICCCSW
jgi:hypothetical protein